MCQRVKHKTDTPVFLSLASLSSWRVCVGKLGAGMYSFLELHTGERECKKVKEVTFVKGAISLFGPAAAEDKHMAARRSPAEACRVGNFPQEKPPGIILPLSLTSIHNRSGTAQLTSCSLSVCCLVLGS